MDFVGYFGFPNGDAPDTSSSGTKRKTNGRNGKRPDVNPKQPRVKSKSDGGGGESEDDGDLALVQLKRKAVSSCGKRQLKIVNGSKAEESRTVGVKKNVATKPMKRHQLGIHSFMTGSNATTDASAPSANSFDGGGKKKSPKTVKKSGGETDSLSDSDRDDDLVAYLGQGKSDGALSLPHEASMPTINSSEPKISNNAQSFVAASSCKRIKISQDDNKKTTGDDELQELDRAENIGNETNEHIKRSRQWKERRRNNSRIFSIRSALHGESQLALNQNHSSRLLRGQGTTNILSHLFQRSIQLSPQNHGLNSYIQSGQHWNTCSTVQLSTKTNGEVCSMSFDTEGVLLATGDDKGFVEIYDFDDVNALDVKERNERNRLRALRGANNACVQASTEDLNNGELTCGSINPTLDSSEGTGLPSIKAALSKPVLSFRSTNYRVTDLKWNPNNQDQLLVAFA